MKLASWVAGAMGRATDVDGSYGAQCVDLVNDWGVMGAAGPTFVGERAAGLVPAIPGFWTWELNYPDNYPPPGAVVLWGPDLMASVGHNGHCAVVLTADKQHLITLDQNWRAVPVAQVVAHTYHGVIGWYKPRQ